jgi:3-methyladenine DNA glycosylase/8-oxoguanine DNA glycosylase
MPTLELPEPYDFDISTRALPRVRARPREPLARGRAAPGRRRARGADRVGARRLSTSTPLDAATEPVVRHYLWRPVRARRLLRVLRERPGARAPRHRLRGLRPPLNPDPFETLVTSITAQQVSLFSAFAVRNRLIERFGTRAELAWAFPDAAAARGGGRGRAHGARVLAPEGEYVIGIARASVDWVELATLPTRR